ncbi:ciliary microtubule associated protein 1B [Rhinoraja longicauda]
MPADPWVGTWRPHRPRMAIAAMYGGPGPKYLLPGHTGYTGHDTTTYRAPAYSLAQRLPGAKDSGTPAPKSIPEKMTHHGKDTVPAWTMGHRPRDIDPSKTPGPANYQTDHANRLVHRSVPAYSMALRTVGFKGNDGPGPARYKDVQVFGPKIPHLTAAPAYTMAQKTAFGSMLSNIVKTPGPCAYKHVDTDVFKNRAPKYTIVERNLIPGDTTMKPGPNRYRTEDVNLHKNYPKYTFGIHHSDFISPLIVTPSD